MTGGASSANMDHMPTSLLAIAALTLHLAGIAAALHKKGAAAGENERRF